MKKNISTIYKKSTSLVLHLLVNIIIFKSSSLLLFFLLVIFLALLGLLTNEPINIIRYYKALYNLYNFTFVDLYLLNFSNLLRCFFIDKVYAVNPLGLIIFSISTYISKLIESKLKWKILRIKSHILD